MTELRVVKVSTCDTEIVTTDGGRHANSQRRDPGLLQMSTYLQSDLQLTISSVAGILIVIPRVSLLPVCQGRQGNHRAGTWPRILVVKVQPRVELVMLPWFYHLTSITITILN